MNCSSVQSLYDLLVNQHGYRGSYKSVLRYVRRRMVKPKVRPFRRVETAPGAQAQVDWVIQQLRESTPWGVQPRYVEFSHFHV